MSCSTQTKSWSLSSYSRFKPNKNLQVPGEIVKPGCNGNWITEEKRGNNNLKLNLTSSGHLVIKKNESILENIFLPFSSTAQSPSLKILKNSNSLVFLYNVNCETRIFRVQFVQSENNDVIDDCADNLAKYFSVRSSDQQQNSESQPTENSKKNHKEKPETSISFSVLTSKILENKIEDLPKIYQAQAADEAINGNNDVDNLKQFLCLCLADPSFPSYVEKVERILKSVANEESK